MEKGHMQGRRERTNQKRKKRKTPPRCQRKTAVSQELWIDDRWMDGFLSPMPRCTNIPDYLTNQFLHRRRTDKRKEMRRAHQNACNLCGASCASTTTGRDPSHSPSLQSRATSGWLLRSTQPTPNPTDQAPFQKPSKDRRASSTNSSHGAAVSGSARPRRCRHRRRARALLPSRLGAVGLARRVPHGRRGPLRLRRIRQAGGVAGPGRELRRRIQLHGEVPLRRVQRRDEAGARQLRRHRHLLLRT
jgi:hypothetical protein